MATDNFCCCCCCFPSTVGWVRRCGASEYRVLSRCSSPAFILRTNARELPLPAPSSHTQSLTPGWPCCLPDLLISQQLALQLMQREGSGSHGKHMSGVGTPAAGPERTELGWFLLPTFFRFSNSANTFMSGPALE